MGARLAQAATRSVERGDGARSLDGAHGFVGRAHHEVGAPVVVDVAGAERATELIPWLVLSSDLAGLRDGLGVTNVQARAVAVDDRESPGIGLAGQILSGHREHEIGIAVSVEITRRRAHRTNGAGGRCRHRRDEQDGGRDDGDATPTAPTVWKAYSALHTGPIGAAPVALRREDQTGAIDPPPPPAGPGRTTQTEPLTDRWGAERPRCRSAAPPRVRFEDRSYTRLRYGTWRSSVAHLLWEQGVGSSNLPVPTNERPAQGRYLSRFMLKKTSPDSHVDSQPGPIRRLGLGRRRRRPQPMSTSSERPGSMPRSRSTRGPSTPSSSSLPS